MAARDNNLNAGSACRDAEVAINLADGEARGTGNRGRALALLSHLHDLGDLGELHCVSCILGAGCRYLCGLLRRGLDGLLWDNRMGV